MDIFCYNKLNSLPVNHIHALALSDHFVQVFTQRIVSILFITMHVISYMKSSVKQIEENCLEEH